MVLIDDVCTVILQHNVITLLANMLQDRKSVQASAAAKTLGIFVQYGVFFSNQLCSY
jgi:hypothetical protein